MSQTTGASASARPLASATVEQRAGAPATRAPDSSNIDAASVSSAKKCFDAFRADAVMPSLAPVSLSSRVACSIPGHDDTFPHQKGTSCKCGAVLGNKQSWLTETDTRADGLAVLSPRLRALWESLTHPVNEETVFFPVSEWAEPNETPLRPCSWAFAAN